MRNGLVALGGALAVILLAVVAPPAALAVAVLAGGTAVAAGGLLNRTGSGTDRWKPSGIRQGFRTWNDQLEAAGQTSPRQLVTRVRPTRAENWAPTRGRSAPAAEGLPAAGDPPEPLPPVDQDVLYGQLRNLDGPAGAGSLSEKARALIPTTIPTTIPTGRRGRVTAEVTGDRVCAACGHGPRSDDPLVLSAKTGDQVHLSHVTDPDSGLYEHEDDRLEATRAAALDRLGYGAGRRGRDRRAGRDRDSRDRDGGSGPAAPEVRSVLADGTVIHDTPTYLAGEQLEAWKRRHPGQKWWTEEEERDSPYWQEQARRLRARTAVEEMPMSMSGEEYRSWARQRGLDLDREADAYGGAWLNRDGEMVPAPAGFAGSDAERRLLALRRSGYQGPVDVNGHVVDPADLSPVLRTLHDRSGYEHRPPAGFAHPQEDEEDLTPTARLHAAAAAARARGDHDAAADYEAWAQLPNGGVGLADDELAHAWAQLDSTTTPTSTTDSTTPTSSTDSTDSTTPTSSTDSSTDNQEDSTMTAPQQQGDVGTGGRASIAGLVVDWESSVEARQHPETFIAWLQAQAASARHRAQMVPDLVQQFHGRGPAGHAGVPEAQIDGFAKAYEEATQAEADGYERWASEYAAYVEEAEEQMTKSYGAEVIRAAHDAHSDAGGAGRAA